MIYITERPSSSSRRAVEFVDADGAVVAEWQWDRYALCDVFTVNGDRYPNLTLPEVRAELGALDYVLTEEFPPAYAYRAAREAFEWAGKLYADYIEAHTAELVARGHDVADQSLSEALEGNDSL